MQRNNCYFLLYRNDRHLGCSQAVSICRHVMFESQIHQFAPHDVNGCSLIGAEFSAQRPRPGPQRAASDAGLFENSCSAFFLLSSSAPTTPCSFPHTHHHQAHLSAPTPHYKTNSNRCSKCRIVDYPTDSSINPTTPSRSWQLLDLRHFRPPSTTPPCNPVAASATSTPTPPSWRDFKCSSSPTPDLCSDRSGSSAEATSSSRHNWTEPRTLERDQLRLGLSGAGRN